MQPSREGHGSCPEACSTDEPGGVQTKEHLLAVASWVSTLYTFTVDFNSSPAKEFLQTSPSKVNG